MSTTVSYKGNTIATLNNETKTLTTGGTWVEADIQITDTSSSGTGAVSVVDTIDSHGGTVRTITGLDISDTTAVASDVAQGKYFYTADGTKTQGTASGSSSDTWETLVDSQVTIVSGSPNYFTVSNYNEAIGANEQYRVTWENITYTYTTASSQNVYDGYWFGNTSMAGGSDDGSGIQVAFYRSNSSTLTGETTDSTGTKYLKIEKKISGSSSINLQAKTNISPTTSSQTITADSGYDGLSSVQINAIPSMTLPTGTSSTSSGTSKATITPSGSAQYLNIPTGYNGTAQYYTISAVSGGGGSSGQTATGTVTGTGTTTLEIPCSFAPDLIYVYGDLTSSASLRGVVKFTIIKDTSITITNDTSTSNTNEVLYGSTTNVTGYGDSNTPHATYSNNVLTLDMVTDSASTRFASGVTYTYELSTLGTGGGSSSSYTRTVIAAEQTVTPTSNGTYLAATLNTSAFESGAEYIITYNGTEYFYTCAVMWNTNYVLGDINYFYGNTEYPYPFGIIWMSGTTCTLACGDSTAVTVKIEKLELTSGGPPSQTQHSIYFEFSDNTDTTITAYWDDSFISNAITAITPTTYGGKTVTLAQLDGVTWYNPTNIPLNTQLVDYTAVKTGYIIDGSNGGEEAQAAGFASDYIVIDPTMTFTYVGYQWWDAAFYDDSKVFISGFMQNSYADSIENDFAHGTLNPSRIPSNAMYIRLTSYPNGQFSSTTMSLIRTA